MSKKNGAKKGRKQPTARPAVVQHGTGEVDLSISGQLLAEVDDRLVLPPGAPVLMGFHQLNRRRRAQLTRALAKLQPQMAKFDGLMADELAAIQAPGGVTAANLGSALEVGEDTFEFLADVEDLLALIAFDPEAFRRWANDPNTTDEHLLALFSRFARSMNVGEANSSST